MTYVLKTDFENAVYTPYGGAKDFIYSSDHECIIGGPAETGKTLAACWKSHILASKYPGCQGAIVRKSQKSVYGSVLQTFGQIIKDAPVRIYGGEKPEKYIYANGSTIWVGGMDNPDKLLSSERDFVQVNQTEELTLDDWEKITTRVTERAGHIKYPQVYGDCNPAGSKHWIRERAKGGKLKLVNSVHKDNPTLYDQATGELTERGKRTMVYLDGLTGVRRKRLLDGVWATAEGAVYDMFGRGLYQSSGYPGYWC
jgi:phage terminase large subunit